MPQPGAEMLQPVNKKAKPSSRMTAILAHIKRDRQLLILFIPCLLFYLIFRYGPLYGLIIAFKDYSVFKGIMASPWVGFDHFITFFTSNDFWLLFKNTFLLGIYNLIFGFPFPIILAILLNEVRVKWFMKTVQTISYLPAFLSVVVVSSMLIDFMSMNGIINTIISSLGFEKIYFLSLPEWFRTIYVGSNIWSHTGYDAIIFLAAIAGINPSLYEAAKMDGAGRLRTIFSITIPSIMPTILIIFIMRVGSVIRVGYEKVLLLYTPMTYEVSDIFSTFVYRKGILESNFSYSTAVGLFEALIAMVMVIGANYLSKRAGGKGLW